MKLSEKLLEANNIFFDIVMAVSEKVRNTIPKEQKQILSIDFIALIASTLEYTTFIETVVIPSLKNNEENNNG